jgi:hypothetical protein
MRRPLWRALVFAGVIAAVLCAPATAIAHPLGNFTVNRFARIEIGITNCTPRETFCTLIAVEGLLLILMVLEPHRLGS